MDWLRDSTRKWKLKTSLIVYMLVSLFLSIPFGLLIQSILRETRKNYILPRVLYNSSSLFDKIMFSKQLASLIDGLPIILVLIFFYIFFQLFYKHKIQPILNFLDNHEDLDLNEENEFSNKVFELNQENIKLKKENFINIRKVYEVSKKVDTLLHEIKNPLTILSGDIEMLNTNYDFKDPKIKQIISRISRSEKRIQDYINHLNVSQSIKDLEVDIKSISVYKLINIIQTELIHWTREITFTYEVKDLSQIIQLDSELFLEGLINILKNSMNYAKSEIALNIYENDNHLIVEIEDDGPGFTQEALNNYNKPYFSENPVVGNMGLGLYITDEIMKKQEIEMVLSNQFGANTKLFIKKS